ncbi:MAG: 1-deoxy-D-xylulose-5-phosphate reductoisomerase [Candidatus Kapabacteria bacterium]|nr:1-deoxy-D-xylulose-5-phosphate reductoisomerase [Candidatus Kapabacteria bacterium]
MPHTVAPESKQAGQPTITILGSTGSIGSQTIEVLHAHHPHYRVGYLTTNTRIDELEQQCALVHPNGVVISDETAWKTFREQTSFKGRILCGEEGLVEASADEENTLVMSSLVGFSGVVPTLAAIRKGITIALANKETLVSAGELITAEAQRYNAPIIAVDSEHSAILQCLMGEQQEAIEKLIITASGGPFRTFTQEQLDSATPQKALKHPNWTMGAKITIDSATLMNKGLEVIEARWLFGIGPERIDVVVHPQSIIHSMVQFTDGSVKAQLGLPDMKLPIHYALGFPHRTPSAFPRMDISAIGTMTFEQPDLQRFPCLRLAFDALRTGGTATTILNAANEVAVHRFLRGAIGFTDIPRIVESTLDTIQPAEHPSLQDILEHDRMARAYAAEYQSHHHSIITP